MVSPLYILLFGVYVGFGLVIFLFLSPKQATKFISKVLPSLLRGEVRELFQDEEFVTAVFKIPHANIKKIMIEVVANEIEQGTKAIVNQTMDRIQETPTEIPEGLGEHITAVLNGWLGSQKLKANKMEKEASDVIAASGMATDPDNPNFIGFDDRHLGADPMSAIAARLGEKNPLLGFVLGRAMANKGNGNSQSSYNNHNRGGY